MPDERPDERPDRQPEELARMKADPRYSEIPMPCQHCKNLTTVGDQFGPDGWTCEAFPDGIPYTILTNRAPHTEITFGQRGAMVVYDPVIYTEEHSGREWHYTADAGWKYVEEE